MFTLHLCSYSLIPRSSHCPVFDRLGKTWSIYHLSTYVDRGRGRGGGGGLDDAFLGVSIQGAGVQAFIKQKTYCSIVTRNACMKCGWGLNRWISHDHLHTVSDQKLDSGKTCMGSLVFIRCSRYYIASFKAPWNCRKVTSHLFSMKNRHYSFKHYHSVMIMNLASFPGLLVLNNHLNNLYTAVPCRKRCVFQSHCCVWSAISLNFH